MKSLIYRLYQRRLFAEVKGGPLPKHIGLILDGNRRYARQQGWEDVLEAYRRGADKVEEVLRWCDELGIGTVTVWVFSVENQNRQATEVEGLLELIGDRLRRWARDPKFHQGRIRIRALGKRELLPDSLLKAVGEAEATTQRHEGFDLNVAVGYGGRQEIADAVRAFLQESFAQGMSPEAILEGTTPERIEKYLYTYDLPDPDLIIRTSGEVRLSGFMLWQSAYSEFYFCDVYWPAFRKIDFLRAIRSYQGRQRRFGR